MVERRARELNVAYLKQGIRDKATALLELGAQTQTLPSQIAYMGDDWNDIPALNAAGVRIAPANAVLEVRQIAHIVTERSGGDGAVREAIEIVLRARGDYDTALGTYLLSLTSPSQKPVQ
jgi:3-deoxy-D-manno-octulosonate 8-phosphate phosphatase (KDO 8-P phosphatase)